MYVIHFPHVPTGYGASDFWFAFWLIKDFADLYLRLILYYENQPSAFKNVNYSRFGVWTKIAEVHYKPKWFKPINGVRSTDLR